MAKNLLNKSDIEVLSTKWFRDEVAEISKHM